MSSSPGRKASLSSQLRSDIERRLANSHTDRISSLSAQLRSSLQSAITGHKDISDHDDLGIGVSPVRALVEDLMHSDQQVQVKKLHDQLARKEQELTTLRESTNKLKMDAYVYKQQSEVVEDQLNKATSGVGQLEHRLRKLQKQNEELTQGLQAANHARGSAEKAASAAAARAAAAEASATAKQNELDELQAHYRQMLHDKQREVEAAQQALSQHRLDAEQRRQQRAAHEQQLAAELATANGSLGQTKAELASVQALAAGLQQQREQLEEAVAEARRQKKALAENVAEVEGLLSDSERERKSLRGKYVELGARVEEMLRDEAAAKEAAGREMDKLRAALAEAGRELSAIASEREAARSKASALAKQLDGEKHQHKRDVRKLEKRMVRAVRELDDSKQELLGRSGEIMELQNQIRQIMLKREGEVHATEGQAAALKAQIAVLQGELEKQKERFTFQGKEQDREYQERLQHELKQQQIKYERRVQELEHRCIMAQEAAPGGDFRTADPADGGLDGGGSGRLHPSRPIRDYVTWSEHTHILESKLSSQRSELGAQQRRRLEALEREAQSRQEAAVSELQAAAAARAKQTEQQWRHDKERLDARIHELTSSNERLQDEVSTLRGELQAGGRDLQALARECTQLRMQAEELNTANVMLQGRLEEANQVIPQLQHALSEARRENETTSPRVVELASRLEQRTAEATEATSLNMAAHTKLQVMESDIEFLRQQVHKHQEERQALAAALDEATAGRHEAELKLKRAAADQQQLMESLEAFDAAKHEIDLKLQRYEDERTKLNENLAEAQRVRVGLETKLDRQGGELQETQRLLATAEAARTHLTEQLEAADAANAAAKEDNMQLRVGLEQAQEACRLLEGRLQRYEEDQQRLASTIHALDTSKQGSHQHRAGLQHDLDNGSMRSGTPEASPARGRTEGSVGAVRQSWPWSKSKLEPDRSPSSTPRRGRASDTNKGGLQELELILSHVDQERAALQASLEALEADHAALGVQLVQAGRDKDAMRAAMEAARNSAELAAAMAKQDTDIKIAHLERLLEDAQAGAAQLSASNAALRGELARARDATSEQAELARAAGVEVQTLQAQAVELRKATVVAREEVRAEWVVRLKRLGMLVSVQLSAVRGKTALLREEMSLEVSKAVKQCSHVVDEVQAKSRQQLQALRAELLAAAAAQHEAQQAQHAQELAAAQQELAAAAQHGSRLQQQLSTLQQTMRSLIKLQPTKGKGDVGSGSGAESDVAQTMDRLQSAYHTVLQQLQQVEGQLLASQQEHQACQQQLHATQQQLHTTEGERAALERQCGTLSEDLGSCASSLQAVIAAVATHVPLPGSVQEGLQSRSGAVVENNLELLAETIDEHIQAQQHEAASSMSAALHSGPIAELQGRCDGLEGELRLRGAAVAQLEAELAGATAKYADGLAKYKAACVQGAGSAFKQAADVLRKELQALKSVVTELQKLHSSDVEQLQHFSSQQVEAHARMADRVIKELEATATTLQTQLGTEVERADLLSGELARALQEGEANTQKDARKISRLSTELDQLRSRVREHEARDKDKEEELKQLRRSLRQKEMTMLNNSNTDR